MRKGKKFAEGGSARKPGIPLPSDRATGYRSQAADSGMTKEERMNSVRNMALGAASMLPIGRAARAVGALKTAGKPLAEKAAAKVAAKADKPPVDIKLYDRALKNASSKGYGKEGNADIAAKEYEKLWKMKEGGKQFRQNSARMAREKNPEGMKRGGGVKKYARGGGVESKGKTKGRMC